MFEEFEKQLWQIIISTEHASGHSDEKRYHNAKKALFGSAYKADPKPPKDFTFTEMMNLLEHATDTNNFEGAIKSFLQKRQKPIDEKDPDLKAELECDQEEKFGHDLEAIKQYFHRNKDIHQWELYRRKHGS